MLTNSEETGEAFSLLDGLCLLSCMAGTATTVGSLSLVIERAISRLLPIYEMLELDLLHFRDSRAYFLHILWSLLLA
ncbi:hypothetical protein CU669_04860 [Paramagnetospirillum kuznetsovii]|uniref:Uncharacterized protein n=1 Tax=Paramagnetospirillum kuznetsovii TaxID=2053833 RepID=A0A364P298_9PROT|nr:hypothetical protein [Paramagnetospirillum kuznetsovii]RAU23454.1 hypothetical protein CU669_04860 [Paramagnetospirillum kuznetsovii]